MPGCPCHENRTTTHRAPADATSHRSAPPGFPRIGGSPMPCLATITLPAAGREVGSRPWQFILEDFNSCPGRDKNCVMTQVPPFLPWRQLLSRSRQKLSSGKLRIRWLPHGLPGPAEKPLGSSDWNPALKSDAPLAIIPCDEKKNRPSGAGNDRDCKRFAVEPVLNARPFPSTLKPNSLMPPPSSETTRLRHPGPGVQVPPRHHRRDLPPIQCTPLQTPASQPS